MTRPPPHGAIAEFATPEAMVAAVRAARAAGWSRLEAHAPHPVPDAALALGAQAAPVARIAVAAGVAGAAITYGTAWYLSVHDYPLNVGGRPPHAWPTFLPAAYIVGVLWAAAAALLGMLWLNGLPRLHHPVFFARGFDRASQDRCFLFLMADDPRFEPASALAFLRGLDALRVSEVRSA
jgi:hypothetical protein